MTKQWLVVLALIATHGSQALAREVQYHRPVFSADGSGVIFMADRGGDWELYRMNLDGSSLQRLTMHLGWDGYASVSADGQILYDRGGTGRSLRWFRPGSGESRDLLTFDRFGGGPKWFVDGQSFLYMTEASGNRDVHRYWMKDGRTEVIAAAPEHEDDPAPDPSGQQVVLSRHVESGYAVEVLPIAGGDRRRLALMSGRVYGLDWSPAGGAIVFNAEVDGDQEIFTVDIESGRVQQLTDNDANDHLPQFSRDGSRILFGSDRNGPEQVFLMDRSGQNVVRLGMPW